MDELDKYLKEVGERESRATCGPWRGFAGVIKTKHGLHGCNDPDVHKHGTNDSLFIAHSRQDIPKLLEIVSEYHNRFVLACANLEDGEDRLARAMSAINKIAKGGE